VDLGSFEVSLADLKVNTLSKSIVNSCWHNLWINGKVQFIGTDNIISEFGISDCVHATVPSGIIESEFTGYLRFVFSQSCSVHHVWVNTIIWSWRSRWIWWCWWSWSRGRWDWWYWWWRRWSRFWWHWRGWWHRCWTRFWSWCW